MLVLLMRPSVKCHCLFIGGELLLRWMLSWGRDSVRFFTNYTRLREFSCPCAYFPTCRYLGRLNAMYCGTPAELAAIDEMLSGLESIRLEWELGSFFAVRRAYLCRYYNLAYIGQFSSEAVAVYEKKHIDPSSRCGDNKGDETDVHACRIVVSIFTQVLICFSSTSYSYETSLIIRALSTLDMYSFMMFLIFICGRLLINLEISRSGFHNCKCCWTSLVVEIAVVFQVWKYIFSSAQELPHYIRIRQEFFQNFFLPPTHVVDHLHFSHCLFHWIFTLVIWKRLVKNIFQYHCEYRVFHRVLRHFT